jgi:hypothetical protein
MEAVMSDEARNVEVLKAAYDRWRETKGASVDDWMKVCADNMAFGSLAQGRAENARYLTAYSSRDALKEYFGGLARDWEMLDWKVNQYIAQGDSVAVVSHCTWKFKKTGKTVATPKVDIWKMAGGKAVEFYEYFDTAQVHAAVA